MEMTRATAEKRISELKMGDLPLMPVTPVRATVPADWFAQYRALRRRFMESLEDSVQDFVFLNLSRDDFMDMMMGRRMPENMSLRFRVPLMWGGELSIENMFMCMTFPHAQNMDRFIMEQNGAQTIWLPNPARKVYLPVQTGGGGAGGNATEDRLTQMASMGGNGME